MLIKLFAQNQNMGGKPRFKLKCYSQYCVFKIIIILKGVELHSNSEFNVLGKVKTTLNEASSVVHNFFLTDF